MQPSTWNDFNQHWLSQFLLKGFGIRRRASEVYELDKETNAIGISKVSEAASKRHLLTERDDAVLREIENRANPVISAIRKGRLNIEEAGRQAVDRLVCAMMLNDPYSHFDAEETREKVISEVIAEWGKSVREYGGLLDEQDFRDLFDERFNHDVLSNFMNSMSNRVILALRFMGLEARRPVDGEFFVIGDSPVLVIRGAVNGEHSLLNPGSQVILPMSSRCVLVYTWAIEANMVAEGDACDKEQVRSLNSDYYYGTKSRCIYGRDKGTLKRCRLLSLKWTERERSYAVQSGWLMMQQLHQIRERQLDVQDADQARMRDYGARDLVARAIAQSSHTQA